MRLRHTYGEVFVPKGTRLYHTSDTPFRHIPEKPMIFTTFHPSDWPGTYITTIETNRDITLLFMIERFKAQRIQPLLDILIGRPGHNMTKQYDSARRTYVRFLQRDGFDGWLSTIEGGTTVEVALRNDRSLFHVISSEPLEYNWQNSYYNNNIPISKNWGTRYPIGGISPRFHFRLNRWYEPQIAQYLSITESDKSDDYSFPHVLRAASFEYIDAPHTNVRW
jgi:hypothetical protein